MTVFSVRLPEVLNKRLEALCDEIERDKIYVIKQSIETFLNERSDKLISITRLMKNEKEIDLVDIKGGAFKILEKALEELKSLSKEEQDALVDYLENTISQQDDPKALGVPLVNERSGLWLFACNGLNIICALTTKDILVIRISKQEEASA